LIFLLTRILWLRRSKWQFLLAGFAYAIGLVIMLTALEAYLSIERLVKQQKEKGQYIIVNKKISIVNTLGLGSSSFNKQEVSGLEKAPFSKKVGLIESNQFQASIRARQLIKFYTMVFFESVSNYFIDEDIADFKWREGQKKLPIIVSQDFLNVYNFGFALSQNLPQVSREALKMVSFDVVISGPGGEQVFEGEIIGFTERISSVLVPQSFMRWANRTIASKSNFDPSRVIIQVESISDPSIAEFLKKNRMTTDQEKMQLGKTGTILNTVMKVAALLGVIFVVLAFIMFSMNFKLILAEASADIKLMIELGYRHTVIGGNLLSYFSAFLFVLFCLCTFVLMKTNAFVQHMLQGQGIASDAQNIPYTSILVGALFSIGIILVNGYLIIRQLQKTA
jgi:hypothetical protein